MANHPVKLPDQLLEKPKRTIGDMEVGETAFALMFALRVDLEKNCFLERKAELFSSSDNFMSIRVTRDADGYHVAASQTFTPFDFKHTDKLIPVASIEVLEKR